ncbi:hypothetical protein DL764_004902 [Monosporascus ibericus]|uniref:Uncharacterized protein n=1 Tax=Monosporascus ibericus TaxID=155417 RepID=A0A4Q4TE78_9PEZI|nr:hypothetical protein DL764_004902 [Monosporascus ibericus]
MESRTTPQAFLSSYAPRLRAYNNSLLTPVIHSNAPTGPLSRTTKRGTTIVNYAEDGFDYDDDDDDDSRRRPTGLRSIRREDSSSRADAGDKFGKETSKPVNVQGIYREWMLKTRSRSDLHNQAQASMPVTLIPIRIDVDVPAFVPVAPLALPRGVSHAGPNMDPTLYRNGEMTVPFKLRDIFLWNLHETVITTDQFAATLVQDLDLPNQGILIGEISKQIRTQLEEYAGVALHPLFHSEDRTPPDGSAAAPAPIAQPSFRDTPATPATPLLQSTRGPETPFRFGVDTPTKVAGSQAPDVTATATPIPASSDDLNPDDTYRCIVNLNINLSSQLYTDKFEWSLLHPPGTAEAFAKVTCADLGLAGEWVPALTHAIYEAVLRLKKEACESGGLVAGWGAMGTELPNDAAHGGDAGWRYDPEHLADEWEPKIEFLSKEEMEKREIDRERQIRRLRRETARFSSNTGMIGGTPLGGGLGLGIELEEERMGRGERSKRKRRFRSLSPLGRSGTPGGRGTPDAGYGGGSGSLTEQERLNWRCSHCRIWGTSVWAVRDGPHGPKVISLRQLRPGIRADQEAAEMDEELARDRYKTILGDDGLVIDQVRHRSSDEERGHGLSEASRTYELRRLLIAGSRNDNANSYGSRESGQPSTRLVNSRDDPVRDVLLSRAPRSPYFSVQRSSSAVRAREARVPALPQAHRHAADPPARRHARHVLRTFPGFSGRALNAPTLPLRRVSVAVPARYSTAPPPTPSGSSAVPPRRPPPADKGETRVDADRRHVAAAAARNSSASRLFTDALRSAMAGTPRPTNIKPRGSA